ncbi:MAG TPA: Gfo/Idh/MocA family oxidoreductase [Caldilineaceae bacterium]|nr:Gfo/Idh/MocA family oxidoreductase [Caldilineaceae bacterium]
MIEQLRVGILGAGWAAEGHATAYAQLPNVTVTALWSRTRGRAEALASRLKQPGLHIYDYWKDLIEQSKVDVISIATSPMLRREPVLSALAKGCHVLVEKPISVGVAEAQVMVNAAEAAKTVTATCFNWRYAPAHQVAWRVIQEGEIGSLRDVRSTWLFRMTTRDFVAARPWITRMDIANGPLGEALSHDLDKTRFLTGSEFRRIVSRITPLTIKQDGDYPFDGARSLHLAELTNTIFGDFYVTPTAGHDEWRLTLLGDEGSLLITDAGQTIMRQRAADDQPVMLTAPAIDQAPAGVGLLQHTWNRLIADFVQAIRQGDTAHRTVSHLPTLLDGLRSEEIIAAARESATEGRWVTVGQ